MRYPTAAFGLCASARRSKLLLRLSSLPHPALFAQCPSVGARLIMRQSATLQALVAEMVGNFGKRLEPYGMKVRGSLAELP